jgi:hypothetical protein
MSFADLEGAVGPLLLVTRKRELVALFERHILTDHASGSGEPSATVAGRFCALAIGADIPERDAARLISRWRDRSWSPPILVEVEVDQLPTAAQRFRRMSRSSFPLSRFSQPSEGRSGGRRYNGDDTLRRALPRTRC